MGIIIELHHARASTVSRAARDVRTSADRDFSRAFSDARTEAHHSAGILSRCHHFETAGTAAPTSAAIASREGHNSITALNVGKSVMTRLIGHLVLKRKAILSLDADLSLGHTVRMADSETETEYKQSFIARVAQARIARNMKQWQIAEAMGIAQDKYKQYESRSLLPHHMIGRFCIICRVEPEWLVTGRGAKPLQPLKVAAGKPDAPPKPIAKRKRSRSKRAA